MRTLAILKAARRPRSGRRSGRLFRPPGDLLSTALLGTVGATLATPVPADTPAEQLPAYIQLRRDVIVNADLWSDIPEILAANYGFEGIIGIPGLQTVDDLDLAVAAGAGVNLDWADLDSVPFRNLTSGAGVAGVALAGYGDSPTYADAMPIEVSWPILPSSLSPDTIEIILNTGDVVTPTAAGLNPNYDHNERHVIVVFGEFGNRLTPGTDGAIYPVQVNFVEGSSTLMAVGPDGPVSLTGLSASSSNPYVAGPALVGAKLNAFSPAGDYAPAALDNASPNDAYSLYGEDAEYRLRLYTSGGFSPDGVSGFLPTDFETFFRLHAVDADGNAVVIDEEGVVYDLGDGTVEVVGLAEVGAPVEGTPDRTYYSEDHDNYFDIILKGDEAAIRLLQSVEIPTSAEDGYSDIYNPGGPGRTPDPDTIYTEAALPQTFVIDLSLDSENTISYASQDLDSYDLDDDFPIVFRLSDPGQPYRYSTSTNDIADLIGDGLELDSVPFANETVRSGVTEVRSYVSSTTGDRIYTLDADEQAELAADGDWVDEGVAFGAFESAVPGTGAIYRFYDADTDLHLFTHDLNDGLQAGYEYQGVGWYAALFVADPAEISFDQSDDLVLTDSITSDGALLKEGEGTLELAEGGEFTDGITVRAGRLVANGTVSGGTLTVEADGTLGGSGVIMNTTTVEGRLAPGESPGTTTFMAPVTLTAGSTLEIEVDGPATTGGAGSYDRVVVVGAGNTFTAAGTLDVRLRGITAPANNTFVPTIGQQFAGIVSAEGGVLGSFATLQQPTSGMPSGTRMDTIYESNAINLVLTPANYGDLAAAGLTQNDNEAQVGAALDAIRPAAGVRPTGTTAELFPALATLSGTEIAPALYDLSGQVHVDALDGTAAGQRLVQSFLATRVSAVQPSPVAVQGGTDGWMHLVGSYGEQRGADGIAGYDHQHHGFAIGKDGRLTPSFRLGFALGHVHTQVSAGDDSTAVGSTFTALYGERKLGGLRLGGHLLGSVDRYDSQRNVQVGTLGSDPRGKADGWGLAGNASLSRKVELGDALVLEPNVGVSFGRVERESFSENDDGAVALDIAHSARSSLRSRLGATLGYHGAEMNAAMSLGWSHEYLDEAASLSASLAGAGFRVRSASPGREALDFSARVGAALGPGVSLDVSYLLTASKAATSHGSLVQLQFTW